jgi:hypothetical protein
MAVEPLAPGEGIADCEFEKFDAHLQILTGHWLR